ncbi:hypothetical protein OQJ18_05205 [Fluoribacter dumoffii]|uniref:DUF883 domain-containing protein n=1 Tax=Fluoribacter dumoffii TaxID=463 RepID=A0A377G9H8_9GAMM|nr:hypothetical protein [Fluoribacter dumoffii]KTC90170.1 hypothetical protein Ldum_1238 [Fluoribacter dumoffii NY 23]MCW8385465.1 hypothetical protein [Fluoribacter dumoffii]MCW8418516.1 hypothetical protein [Fluoribacter dumoffii]MCW8453642.1 hypothetical protein [Fluoribacter dumoffii]MCW8459140.1 hypothetical protein [Fluoribacter dumoffii]
MDDFNENPSVIRAKEHLKKGSNILIDEGKRKASELYHEGLDKASEMEQSIENIVNNLAGKIREKPLSSVLIAAAIGYLWAKIKG